MEEIEKLIVLKCSKCGNKWVRRMVQRPKRCPRCQCRKWDLEARGIDPASLALTVEGYSEAAKAKE